MIPLHHFAHCGPNPLETSDGAPPILAGLVGFSVVVSAAEPDRVRLDVSRSLERESTRVPADTEEPIRHI